MTRDPRVPPDRLHRLCDPETLGFSTTADLDVLEGAPIGQDEAMSALSFGLSLSEPGYSIFVLGAPGSGRLSFARQLTEQHARDRPAPSDWCYVFNFQDERRPRALELPTGRGPELREAMAEIVSDLRRAVPQALESEQATNRRATIVEEHAHRAAALMDGVRKELDDDPWVALIGTADAMTVVGARGGEPLSPEAYEALPEDARAQVDERVRHAARAVFEAQRKVHQVERKAREEVAAFHHDVGGQVVAQRMESVLGQFEGVPSVIDYLGDVADDIVDNVEAFLSSGPVGLFPEPDMPSEESATAHLLRRYGVNVLVTNPEDSGASVVVETNPHLRNLFGRTESQMRFGVMVTDFTQIAPGAAHRANGGYLLVRAEDVLSRPLVWPALKRTLRSRELRPVDASSELGLFAVQSLEPDPIPADLTVIMVGEPRTFYLLQALDSEFDEVFKVKSDFATNMDRDAAGEAAYARLVAAECARRSLPPFEVGAVASLIEESSRLADDQTKLTTRLRPVLDLVLESAHHAGEVGVVTAEHVQAALDHQDLRRRRPERVLLEQIERGVLAFDPVGEETGQLYGIALIRLGDNALGRPIRVMASAYAGRGGIVNIEREAELAGRIHNKGFLVVSGYLGRTFAREEPLTLSGTLSFDQLYEEVEGDSASAAELYALMSAIGDVPLRQGVAVTGAVNQEGMVLPVGGVTAKVEGYYKACERLGLNGEQGVVLPRRNLDHLCLRKSVRDAVAEGRFHLWGIDRVEEGWPILADRDAGDESGDGTFPEGTVHHAVRTRLAAWAERWRRMDEGSEDEGPVDAE